VLRIVGKLLFPPAQNAVFDAQIAGGLGYPDDQ
jgi:hypothetical protein